MNVCMGYDGTPLWSAVAARALARVRVCMHAKVPVKARDHPQMLSSVSSPLCFLEETGLEHTDCLGWPPAEQLHGFSCLFLSIAIMTACYHTHLFSMDPGELNSDSCACSVDS